MTKFKLPFMVIAAIFLLVITYLVASHLYVLEVQGPDWRLELRPAASGGLSATR